MLKTLTHCIRIHLILNIEVLNRFEQCDGIEHEHAKTENIAFLKIQPMIILPNHDVCHLLRTIVADRQLPTLIVEKVYKIDVAIHFGDVTPDHFNLPLRIDCQFPRLEVIQDAMLLQNEVSLTAHLDDVPQLFLVELCLDRCAPFQ